jgi:hypothetical protein
MKGFTAPHHSNTKQLNYPNQNHRTVYKKIIPQGH